MLVEVVEEVAAVATVAMVEAAVAIWGVVAIIKALDMNLVKRWIMWFKVARRMPG